MSQKITPITPNPWFDEDAEEAARFCIDVFGDPKRAERAMQAMLKTRKLDVGALRAAAAGRVPYG